MDLFAFRCHRERRLDRLARSSELDLAGFEVPISWFLSLIPLSLYKEGSCVDDEVSILAVWMAFLDDNDGLVLLATIPKEKRMALVRCNES